jgi:hypothetical protein
LPNDAKDCANGGEAYFMENIVGDGEAVELQCSVRLAGQNLTANLHIAIC